MLQLNNVVSYCERVEYSFDLSEFCFNESYNLMHLMYENRTVSIQPLILHLMARDAYNGVSNPLDSNKKIRVFCKVRC